MIDPSRILDVALRAGELAAKVCLRVQAEDVIAGLDKSDKSPVTVADFASQALILRELAAAFPDHAILAEENSSHIQTALASVGERVHTLVGDALGESLTFAQLCGLIDHQGDANSPYRWAIDPIDGTKGFLRRQQYAIAIGLMHHHQPLAGVLVCPSLSIDPLRPELGNGVAFAAFRGQGATQRTIGAQDARPIRVNSTTDRATIRVLGSVEASHGDPALLNAVVAELGFAGGVVRVDSQVKYAVLARGEAEVYLRPQSRPDWRDNVWDHVAGVLVAAEAGARSSDQDGRPLDFSHGATLRDNRGVLTTNGVIHDDVVAAIARLSQRQENAS